MPKSDIEKCILIAVSDGNFILEIFLNDCFSKTAAKGQSGQLPPEENCPPVRVGVSVKVRVSFRVGGKPGNSPGEILPLSYV